MWIFLFHSVVCGSAKFVGRLGWTEKKLGASPSTQSETLHNNQISRISNIADALEVTVVVFVVIAVASDLGGISPGLSYGDPYCHCL